MVRHVHLRCGCVPAVGCYLAEMDDGDETIALTISHLRKENLNFRLFRYYTEASNL